MLRILVMIFLSLSAAAQTQIDLRTQTKSVDFTAAVSTKPLKTGSVLPATCQVGDMFFKTDATPGSNLYGCTAVNNWSIQGGSSDSCGYDTVDGTLKCRNAQGVVYATVQTTNSGTANQWVDYISPTGVPHTSQPTAAAVGALADPGSNGVPYRNGPGVAALATADRLSMPFSCQDTGSSGAYACDLAPPITAYNTGTTYWFKANSANTGAATINFNSLGPKRIVRPSGQDLVAGDIRGGQWVMLTYDGAAMQMQSQTSTVPAAGVSSMFGRTGAVTSQAGDYTTAQITESGTLYFTNARARAALGASGPLTLNLSTGILDCPACLTTTTPADTDLYGNYPHLSVIRIQGRPVATTQPSDLQYLGWNNTAGQWEPKTPPAASVTSVFGRTGALVAAAGDYTTAQVSENGNLYFTNARVWAALSASGPITLNASTGAFGCPNCITTATPADTDLSGSFPHLSVTRIQGRPVASGPPGDAQYLGWNSSANQWEPKTVPALLVASVFGRTGPIVSQSGDYSFAQISGAASAAQLPAAAMRTDQGNTVTAGTQNFSGAAHTLPMKSGLAANLPSLCATGELYFATDAPPGQNTYGCTATNTWSVEGSLTVESAGSTVGQRGAINFEAGAGIVTVMTDSGSEIDTLLGLDTAVVQTPWGEQSGSALLCASTSGSGSSYGCSLQPTLQLYTTGMTLHWTPDVNGAGGPTTLNVDTLGAVPVKQADGATNPGTTDIVAGRMYAVWYDGSGFRLPAAASGGGGGGGGGTWGSIAGTLSNQTDLATALGAKEPGLGNPSVSGYVLSSTVAGVRSWVAQSGGVASVFGRTGAITATSGDYTTDLITEGTAKFFTAARAQAAMSGLYQTPITTGTTAQYFRGDLSLATFPTIPSISGSTLLKGSSGNAAAAGFADVVSLFGSGSCSGFLKSDGTCGSTSGGATWGSITGTLSSQTDLAAALGGKQAAITGAPGTWPTLGTASSHAATDFEAALGNPSVTGYVLSSTTGGTRSWVAQSGSGGMVYPAAGVASSTGSAWGSSYTVGTAANNLVQLNGSAQLPAVSAALLTNFPTLNQSTTGTAAGLTSQYVDWSAASGGASIANKPALGTAASHASTDFAASNAATTVNGQTCALGGSCTINAGLADILRFSICITAGCGSESTLNYIATMASGSFTECSFNLATAATGSSVIVDVRDASGTSIFGATKLVVTVANGTAVEYQSTFAGSQQNYVRGNKYMAIVTQNDSGGTAQGGTVQCR